MRNWHILLLTLLISLMSIPAAFGAASYRSFIEWNGPYYHVRHGLTADSSSYLDYQVNSPLPLFSTPFSSPTAVELFGTVSAMRTFVVDHDHRRVQVFATPANWKDGDEVVIVPSLKDPAVLKEKFPQGWREVKPYLRLTKVSKPA